MHRSPSTLILALIALLSAVGCDQPATTAPSVTDAVESLALNAPVLTSADLVATRKTAVVQTPETNPARVSGDNLDMSRPLQQIFNERTSVAFEPGYVRGFGTHQYIGNVGAVSTTTQVTFQNQHLGSQAAEAQDYTPFLFDFGSVKRIWVSAKVFTDHECGLTGHASSQHSASWQFFQGTGAPLWGKSGEPSQADPKSQGGCSSGTGTGFGTQYAPAGMVCTYLITYELDTGIIVDAELLYCTSSGGEMW